MPEQTKAKNFEELDASKLSIGMFNEDLCTRCGTCGGACPEAAISYNKAFYPNVNPSKCTECGLCNKVCPGDKVSYGDLAKLTFNAEETYPGFDGHIEKTYVGYCTDEGIRGKGAGGGIITGLLWDLLKHGEVDGCIVTRMNPDRPWEGEYFIARTHEELRQSQGSKYLIIPMNHILQEIRDLPGTYAYAALPCQVHGFRMLAAEDPVIAEKIHCVIGLFCGGSLEPYLVPEILRTKGLKPEDIADFEFRGGEWPGKLRAIRKDGTIRDMHNYYYNDGAYNYLTHLYAPKRCQTCLDGSGQFSDVSVSDAWTRDDDGNYLFEAQSRMLMRTQRGIELVERAIERGSIKATDVSDDPSYRTHKMQTKRKGSGAPIRIDRWRTRGIAVPEYDVEFEPFTLREKMNERTSAFFLWCGRYKVIRYPLLKFLTSPASIPIIKVRRMIKKRKYAKRKKARQRASG